MEIIEKKDSKPEVYKTIYDEIAEINRYE